MESTEKAQSRGFGVEPLPLSSVDTEAPFCPHGPTLLFERYYAHKTPRSFFACSVHRNRKGCSFFHWADEPISDDKRKRWMAAFRENQPALSRSSLQATLEDTLSLSPGQRLYCFQCNVLFSESSPEAHDTHSTEKSISDENLLIPTRLLVPVDNRKSQAQFYFSDSSLQLFVGELTRLKFSHVLCVGSPRLHEVLSSSGSINSLLLDIDHRYAQFFPPEKFQRFNMFTCYFYEEGGKTLCEKFLSSAPERTAIVIDPPFGGLAKVLAVGMEGLWEMVQQELTTFLVFPYFMESHLISALPSFWMMDYQVTYENHKNFSADRKSSKPSPVRVYTNLPQPGLKLPAVEGYRLCVPCNRYVAKSNIHCEACNSCTSKDGRQYKHCFSCHECVKPGRVHCGSCGKCELPDHQCGIRASVGCHMCGSLEHKRRDCPNKCPPKTRKRKQKTAPKQGQAKKHKK